MSDSPFIVDKKVLKSIKRRKCSKSKTSEVS